MASTAARPTGRRRRERGTWWLSRARPAGRRRAEDRGWSRPGTAPRSGRRPRPGSREGPHGGGARRADRRTGGYSRWIDGRLGRPWATPRISDVARWYVASPLGCRRGPGTEEHVPLEDPVSAGGGRRTNPRAEPAPMGPGKLPGDVRPVLGRSDHRRVRRDNWLRRRDGA